MTLARTLDTLNLLGDESRIRLCALLSARELCVTDLVRVTGISQSRVSTHLARLREAGFVRDRRQGPQAFYALADDSLPETARAVLAETATSGDPTLASDLQRLRALEAERRGDQSDADGVADDMERDYSPGRTWHSLAMGMASLLELGDVLDVGSGDGAAARAVAGRCRSLTCIDRNPRLIALAKQRLARFAHARVQVADVHELPFRTAAFDAVLMFHTLTYAQRPARALAECARVLRPGGRLVVLCLDQHAQGEVTARHGERHPGFSPRSVRHLLAQAGLEVVSAEVACREARKPHLQVVLASAEKPEATSATGDEHPGPSTSHVDRAHRRAVNP
jgi:ArsR family transcriptional regulator